MRRSPGTNVGSAGGMDALDPLIIRSLEARGRRRQLRRRQTYMIALLWRWSHELQRLEWTCSSAVERRDSLYKTLTSCIIKRHNLRKVNCINDCFYIWHSGHSSRINSFRLGRLPFQQVDLHEVNAALGEVVRLLSALQFKSPRFQLIHMGSYSKIQYDSFSLLPKRNFNQGLQTLATCIQEISQMIHKIDPAMRCPLPAYSNFSPRLSCSGDTVLWTNAMKEMLIHLKWAITYQVKHELTQLLM
mmetsp:Transcript_25400/g.101212  ORF Transcript_25400/g.101212 Transcript_25400/m.101212 type:complete len:245 (+) Transcript_25400:190-924(+)